MSKLSGQADRLRRAAQTARDMGKYKLEQMLLDAADTILQLRDDLQKANENERLFMVENDRLRKRVHELELENIRLASDNCDLRCELGIEVN